LKRNVDFQAILAKNTGSATPLPVLDT